jgi:SAM-dependent methyltransferase
MTDARQHAPATARNRDPILDVLRRLAPPQGTVLEVASGSGEHAAHFAQALPGLVFQPTDPDPARRASIDAWCAGLANVRPALALDAAGDAWPAGPFDLLLCCNMIHIAPWSAAEGLVAGAGRVLAPGGLLLLYGPFRRQGVPTAPGNEAFDASLRAQNPAWGLRDLEAVDALAQAAGLTAPGITEMPANNLCVAWRRRAT